MIVEHAIPMSAQIIPKDMDDLWEEEYIPLSKGLEYNGLVIIQGDRETVLRIAEQHGLPTPPLDSLPSPAFPTSASPSSSSCWR